MANKRILTREQRQVLIDDFKDGFARKIEVVDSEKYAEHCMTVYGVNIVALRQFSRLEDGLNPVVRRLLWTMGHDHDLRPDKRFVKVPEFLGHVSKYHPHGDIGNTFDCLARPWESNVPLMEIRGNKGSESGEDPAAPRYLDAKLSEYAWDCFFSEFDADIAEMTDNYIRSDKEPVYFPAKYPHFLLNTSSGIGWGFACYYPPFNLIESFRLVQALIENPNMTNVYLFPDSPRGYNIIDDGTALETCENGIGTFKTEANIEYVPEEHALYVTGFPEKVMYEKVMKNIATLSTKQHKISGIANMADTSDLDVASFMIELKKDANPNQVIDELMSNNTGLKDSTSLALYFAERTSITPYPYSLKGACLEWVRRRIVDKQKYYIKRLGKEQRRKRALEGVIPILSNYDSLSRVQKIIMTSEDAEDSIVKLKDAFPLTSSQCTMLMDMKYGDSAKARVSSMEKEVAKLTESIKEERRLVVSHDTIKDVIYKDLEYGIQKYGKPRMCPIIDVDNRERPELFYKVVVTQKFIKKLSVGSRAGVGSADDNVIGVFPNVSENDKIIVIDDLGKVYTIQIRKLPPCDISSKGTDMLSEVGLKGTVIRAIQVHSELVEKKDDAVLAMFTSSGIIKASPLSQYLTNKTEIQGILLDNSDKVCWAHLYDKNDSKVQQLAYTTNGFGISFNISNIKIQDRLTKGTTCLKLDEGDSIQGGVQVSLDDNVLVVTVRGCLKVCELASIFEASKRKQNMLRITSLDDKDSVFKIIPLPVDFSGVTVYLKSGEKVKLDRDDIPKLPRLAKCKKLVPVKLGDSIYKVIVR